LGSPVGLGGGNGSVCGPLGHDRGRRPVRRADPAGRSRQTPAARRTRLPGR